MVSDREPVAPAPARRAVRLGRLRVRDGDSAAVPPRLVLLAPVALIVSMYAVFQLAVKALGIDAGFVVGFATYWLVWCLAVPLWMLGGQGVGELFASSATRGGPNLIQRLLLIALPAFGLLVVFPLAFPGGGDRLVVAFAAYALVNGVVEEIFWRGLPVRAFPGDFKRAVLLPAAGYALWMLVPLSVQTEWPPFASQLVVAVALPVGLIFGWVAWRTGSIRWTVLSHVLMNLSGLGAFIAFRPFG
jgi:membrane protease YdiL (CAAX protease family)